jgi:hypothetical protein
LPLQAAIEEESRGLREGELGVVDPDSRMTQLGMLPLIPQDRDYYHFESRRFRAPGCDRLRPLARRWCDGGVGEVENSPPSYPLSR